jgi:hypothetical protein
LLARFNELDKRLGDHTAVELLEMLQSTLVIAHDLLNISHANGNHVRGCIRREVIAIRDIIITGINGGSARRISTTATNSARGCLHSTAGTRLKAHALTKDLEEVLADFRSEKGGVLFLDRGRLVNLDLALIVEVNHSVVCIRQAGR